MALLRSEFGRDGEAADTLLARGAVSVIQVIDDARRYRLFCQTRGETRLLLNDGSVRSSCISPLPAVLAGPRMTATLYTGLTGVGSGSWNDAHLNGWRAEVRLATRSTPARASNIACLLPGTGEQGRSAIMVSAHYDHLGVGVPDASGDSIYNGFSDNAAGVAMALGIGEALAHARRSEHRGGKRAIRHALLLFFSTGEEHGLLGADYFVHHPLWPLARIDGVINLDANAPAARPRSWRIAGEDGSELVRREAAREGREATLAPPSPGSDYYPFVRHGVPAVFFVPGDGAVRRPQRDGIGQPALGALGTVSHAGGQLDERFPLEGLGRYADFAVEVILGLDGAYRPTTGGTSRTGPGGSR